MPEERIATLVRRVEELAAVTPSTLAIIIALDHQEFNALASGLHDAFEAMLGAHRSLPWVVIIPGEVGLVDSIVGHPEAGIFIGREQLPRLAEMRPEDLKKEVLSLMKKPA